MRTLVAAMISIVVALLSSCSEAGAPGSATWESTSETVRSLNEVKAALDRVRIDKSKVNALLKPPLRDSSGAALFGHGIQSGLFDEDLCKWLVIPGGKDEAADGAAVKSSGQLEAESCSFCTVEGAKIPWALMRKGEDRTVVLCPNSRNWPMFGDTMPIMFSDGETPTIVSFQDMKRDYQITEDEWKDPAGKLFGKKAPFDHIYE
ncbi:MAG: hypothetical protein IPK87_15005 [Planctomycetes bacterium]|nr:hypothetical protein [Planctomycetota bacterium]